jgi:predicted lipoprotein
MRGNAIRDASGFKFEDFTNQVQFAQLLAPLTARR